MTTGIKTARDIPSPFDFVYNGLTMRRFSAILLLCCLFGAAFPAVSFAASLTPFTGLQSGDLVRGQTFAAVYYLGRDGFRYVFPNDKTYFTWYANFNTVKWVSDADLAKLQIGGNVTYKPGSKMVKINSDPKVYAVDQNGELRWVTTEEIAIALYGASWNTKIDDVPDAFFGNYRKGGDVETASDFVPSDAGASSPDINHDKDLKAATVLNISDDGYDNASVTVKAGTPVRWYNMGGVNHTATADDLTWGTGTISPNGNFARYFNDVGTYSFFDSYHPSLTATLVVEP